MSLFDYYGIVDRLFHDKFNKPNDELPSWWWNWHSDSPVSASHSSQFNDNFIGNNGAILLTDDAQNTVNFLYINPIEFFNNGRASDITINYAPEGVAETGADAQESAAFEQDVESMIESSDNSMSTSQFNDNIIGNNAAILLADDAQNTVNFLYVNPIEFFNNGRAGDIYLNIINDGGSVIESAGQQSSLPVAAEFELAEASPVGTSAERDQFVDLVADGDAPTSLPDLRSTFPEELGPEDRFSFLNDFDGKDAAKVLEKLDLPSPLSLLDALGNPDLSDSDSISDDIVDSITENLEDGSQINDNVIGNNTAILLTDDAQNTVNFLYVNPIEFFNNGRASDIYLNITPDGSAAVKPAATKLNEDAATALAQPAKTPIGEQVRTEPSEQSFSSDAFDFLADGEGLDVIDFLDELECRDPLTLLDALGTPDLFDTDQAADDIVEALTDDLSDGSEINGNVVGNNAAILLTDNAQNTVNFLYINPIQFFNDGRAGDIYLNISLEQDDGLVIL